MHLVSLSAVTWDFRLVGRTRMLTEAWQRMGQATMFVQVASYRTAWERMLRSHHASRYSHVKRPWPTYPARLWPKLSGTRLRTSIGRRAAELRRQLDQSIDWEESIALVVSPVWAPWLEKLPFRAVVYDCIDDLSVHVPDARLQSLYEAWEDELVERASGAVVSANVLGGELRARRPGLAMATIRNGVDSEAFEQRARSAFRPSDLPSNTRPLVGFVGALYQWIDWKLVEEVAAALPEFDFVFVGPNHRADRAGRNHPKGANLFYTGPKPYADVPAYIAAFDACWIPFKSDQVARSANPVKIYEYLALGKPVVSVPIADPESYEGLVVFGRDADEIARGLRTAVRDGDSLQETRVRFARANSWDARAAQYVEFAKTLL